MVYFDKLGLVFADKPQGQMAARYTHTHISRKVPQVCEKLDEPQFNIEAIEMLLHIVASDLWP